MTERERLLNLLKQNNACAYMDCEACMMTKKNLQCIPKDITDYLLDNGVIVPPCKVGDTGYGIILFYDDAKGKQRRHTCYSTNLLIRLCVINKVIRFEIYKKPISKSDFTRIGKSIFLTREEAEKAIEKIKQEIETEREIYKNLKMKRAKK